MPQAFGPTANFIAKWSIPLLVAFVILGLGVFAVALRSDYNTGVRVPIEQPLPFSHKHHVQGLGLDCRYCHTTVEHSASAGIPDLHTCMGCHSTVWSDAAVLEPLRKAYKENKAIEWNRVNKLPDYVYFHHGAHVSHGIACSACHGDVGAMPVVMKARSFLMEDCLSCHRVQEKNLGPSAERLIQCNTCHR